MHENEEKINGSRPSPVACYLPRGKPTHLNSKCWHHVGASRVCANAVGSMRTCVPSYGFEGSPGTGGQTCTPEYQVSNLKIVKR